jgi:hypothetical protein
MVFRPFRRSVSPAYQQSKVSGCFHHLKNTIRAVFKDRGKMLSRFRIGTHHFEDLTRIHMLEQTFGLENNPWTAPTPNIKHFVPSGRIVHYTTFPQ